MDVINYYSDMWSQWSHTLAPLTRLMYIKWKFKLTKVEPNFFDKIKRIMARDTLLTFPGFNETFKINTNDTAFQLGAVIVQKGKYIAFYNIKLTGAQKRYIIT